MTKADDLEFRELATMAGMVAAEGSNTVFKAATSGQPSPISYYIFTFYACSAAALLLLPFAFIFRRPVHFNLFFQQKSFLLRLLCVGAFGEFAPLAGMVAVECANVASKTVYKAISARDISFYVFTFYTCLVAALVLLPFAIIFRRSGVLPSNKLCFLLKLILLSSMGVACQLLGFKGLELSSPTLSSAISNLIPALTFILAVLFGPKW